jgi:hypothetical protein
VGLGLVAAVALGACGGAGRGPVAQTDGSARLTGMVVLVSDVLSEEPVPQRGGEVRLVDPGLPNDPPPGEALAVLPIGDGGRFDGSVPSGRARTCVVQPSGGGQCSAEPIEITGDARLTLELGDGFLGTAFDG